MSSHPPPPAVTTLAVGVLLASAAATAVAFARQRRNRPAPPRPSAAPAAPPGPEARTHDAPRPSQATGRWLAVLVAIVAAPVAAVAHLTSSSAYVWDDFMHFRIAQVRGLSLGYLAESVCLHFAPGHRLGNWALQSLLPMRFGAAQVLMLAVLAGSILLMHRLLAELFRPGPGPLLLTLLYATSVVHVAVVQWWTAGLHYLPATVFTLLSLLSYLRYFRTESRRHLALSVAYMAAGLLFHVSALLAPLYLVLFRVLLLDPRASVRQGVASVVRERRVWAGYAVPVAVYLAVYLTWYWTPLPGPGLAELGQYLQISWVRVFAPSLLGFSLSLPKGAASANAGLAGVITVQAIVVVVVAWSLLRRAGAWRAWAFFAAAFLAHALLSGVATIGTFGAPFIAHQLRYYLAPTFLSVIALGAAFLPVRSAGPAPAYAAAVSPQSPTRRALTMTALTLAVVAHLGLAWSGGRRLSAANVWFGPLAGRYTGEVERGLTGLRNAGNDASVVDGVVPEFVVGAVLSPYNRHSRVLPLFDAGISFDRPDRPLFFVGPDGSLNPVASLREGRALVASLADPEAGAAGLQGAAAAGARLCVR